MSNFFLPFLSIAAVIIILSIPIKLHGDFYYELGSGKTGFCLTLFGLFKIFGGYMTTCPGGIAVHVSDKTAHLLSYRQIDDDRKKYTKQNGITIAQINAYCESGLEYYLQLALLENAIKTIGLFFSQKDTRWRVLIAPIREETIRFYAKIVIKIALIVQIFALLKYLIGRIKLWQMKAKN